MDLVSSCEKEKEKTAPYYDLFSKGSGRGKEQQKMELKLESEGSNFENSERINTMLPNDVFGGHLYESER